ncbi:hypothetical protein ECHSTV_0456 [Ehrlichia chaffeensis str. Saint Vincent]|nr:hypothetical protein ECHSTV_0456 [Ehrlichia chaffeensis str. Saint Vincent]
MINAYIVSTLRREYSIKNTHHADIILYLLTIVVFKDNIY